MDITTPLEKYIAETFGAEELTHAESSISKFAQIPRRLRGIDERGERDGGDNFRTARGTHGELLQILRRSDGFWESVSSER